MINYTPYTYTYTTTTASPSSYVWSTPATTDWAPASWETSITAGWMTCTQILKMIQNTLLLGRLLSDAEFKEYMLYLETITDPFTLLQEMEKKVFDLLHPPEPTEKDRLFEL